MCGYQSFPPGCNGKEDGGDDNDGVYYDEIEGEEIGGRGGGYEERG